MLNYNVYGETTKAAHEEIQSFIRTAMGTSKMLDLRGEAVEEFAALFTKLGFDGRVTSLMAARRNTFPEKSIQYVVIVRRSTGSVSIEWSMLDT